MTQKRLLGLLGAVAIIAAACGGSTATQRPAARRPVRQPAPRMAIAGRRVGRPRRRAGPPPVPVRSRIRPPLDPDHGAGLRIASPCSHALNRGLLYFDKDQNIVPALAEALPEISRRRPRPTRSSSVTRKYSNGDPIVADDLVFAWKRLIDPRTARRTTRRIIADVDGGQELLDHRPRSSPDRCRHRGGDGQASASRRPTTRRSSSSSTTRPATSSISPPCGAPRPTRRSGSPARTPPRRQLRQLRPVHAQELEPPGRDRPRAEPELVWRRKPTLTEIRYHIGGDPAAAQAAFEAGEIDMRVKAPPDEVPRIKDDPELGPLIQARSLRSSSTTGASDTAKGPDRQQGTSVAP